MAQYTERLNASDSFQRDINGKVTRGTTLSNSVSFSFTSTGDTSITAYYATSLSEFEIVYPKSTKYKKKRLVSEDEKVYVISKSTSHSGTLGTNSDWIFPLDMVSDPWFRRDYGPVSASDQVSAVPTNQYRDNSWLGVSCGTTGVLINGRSYKASANITISSHTGDHPPYIERIFADVPVSVKGDNPINIYINPHETTYYTTFNFTMTQQASTEVPLYIKQAKFRWRVYGQTTYKETTHELGGTSKSEGIRIKNSTFPAKSAIEWQVLVMSDDGIWSNPSSWYYINTTDATAYAYASSPVNEYVDGSKPVTLRWYGNSSTGTWPNGADFQVSEDNGITWSNLGHTQGYSDLQVIENSLPAGSILWRVRAYNADDVAGPWSDAAAIVVRRAPNAPGIATITTFPKPIISWNAEGQQAYHLKVGTWDSSPVYGSTKVAQVPVFLPNGTVQVLLRVQNSFGLWSDWTTSRVTIQNRPGADITLQARLAKGGIKLTWSTTGKYTQYIIYRDGKEVGSAAGKAYTDYTGPAGKASYVVRGVNADSTYTDSNRAIEILRLDSGMIAIAEVWEWLPLKCLRGRYPGTETSEEVGVTYNQYSGRTLPVAEISGHLTRQHKLEFTFRKREELEALRGMLGQIVIYKDMWGRLFTGILDSIKDASDWASDVSFTITEVDHGTEL